MESGQKLLDLYYEIQNTLRTLETVDTDLIVKEKARVEIENLIHETGLILKQVEDKLGAVPDENISQMVDKLHERINASKDIETDLVSIENQIRDTNLEKDALEKERDAISKSQRNVRKIQYREYLAQRASEELTAIFERFSEDTRQDVEKLTNEEFHGFIPTVKELDVGISPEFHYDVRDQEGNPALSQLSMGQKQSLSLAFITSISRISEKEPPLVIDMPFGRLEKEVQENIASRLPVLASQVILMMLPETEWNDATEKILKPKANSIYKLEFDPVERNTTIIREGE
jgi:DNA sulfur modification protein DndD